MNCTQQFTTIEDPIEREKIVRSVLNSHFPASYHILSQALHDKDSNVRFAAAEEIGTARLGELVPALMRLVQTDSDYMVRVAAIESLGTIADRRAVSALLDALKDRNALVRGWSATALSQFPTADVIDALRQAIISEKSHFVKVCALSSSILLGEKHVLPELIAELRWSNYRVRCAAATSLADVADKASMSVVLEALCASLRREKTMAVRSSIGAALSRLARVDHRAVSILEEAFASQPNDAVVALHLCKAYVLTHRLGEAKALIEAQTVKQPEIKEWAARDPDLHFLVT